MFFVTASVWDAQHEAVDGMAAAAAARLALIERVRSECEQENANRAAELNSIRDELAAINKEM